jgi:hypothetical protein
MGKFLATKTPRHEEKLDTDFTNLFGHKKAQKIWVPDKKVLGSALLSGLRI